MRVELLRGDLTLDDDDGDDAVPEPVVGCADDRDLTDGRCRATTSSTSSGCTFSPPETIMSSSRPSSQRSPSSSSRPTSPVWYQPSRICCSSASGRFQ